VKSLINPRAIQKGAPKKGGREEVAFGWRDLVEGRRKTGSLDKNAKRETGVRGRKRPGFQEKREGAKGHIRAPKEESGVQGDRVTPAGTWKERLGSRGVNEREGNKRRMVD